MDKEVLLSAFTKGQIHRYACPYCSKGELSLEGEFNSKETVASIAEHDTDYWDPDFIRLIFSCTLQCIMCKERVFVVGDGYVNEEYEVDQHGGWDRDFIEYFQPAYFHPPLQLIEVPASTPEKVSGHLTTAFASFFSSPAICCSSIRSAGEEILTALDVPLHHEADSRYLPFAQRIKNLGEERESVRKLFDAIRWLGNFGSHSGSQLESGDALSAFKIMELLLEEIFSDRKKKIQELADAINSNKGPISRLPRAGGI